MSVGKEARLTVQGQLMRGSCRVAILGTVREGHQTRAPGVCTYMRAHIRAEPHRATQGQVEPSRAT